MFLDNYERYRKDLEVASKKMIDYSILIEQCSSFDLEIVGSLLARIVSNIENREFVFKQNVYIICDEEISPYERLNLLVESEMRNVSFSTETFMRFSRRGVIFDESRNIFVLNKERKICWFDGYHRTIYHPVLKECFSFYEHIEPRILHYKNINFENFSYLKSFIDYVIDYRIQNHIVDVSEEELNEMANQFLAWYKSEDKSEEFVMKLERK